MSVTVTVHSGELKRIRQLISGPIAKKKKSLHGQLYGLWTHSNQPVIQYVIGDPKDDKEVATFLWENHGLRHLGSWSTEEFEDDGISNGKPPPSFVNMTVELLGNGKVMNVKLNVFEKESKLNGVLEMLEGHSAFRLKSPFSDQKDQKLRERYHNPPDNDDLDVRDLSEKPSCQAETKEEQWYSREDGMQLFGKIHGALQQQFEITGTSRDTKTHDLCVSLKSKGREFAVDFPSNFPHGLAILTRAGNHKEEIHLTETSSEEKKSDDSKGKKTTNAGQDKKKTEEERQTETFREGEKSNGSKGKKTTHAGQDKKKNANDVEPQEHLDPEKIPQLLAQAIHRQVFGTKV